MTKRKDPRKAKTLMEAVLLARPKNRKKRDPLAGLKKKFSVHKSVFYPDLCVLVVGHGKISAHVCYCRSENQAWTVARAIAKLGAK